MDDRSKRDLPEVVAEILIEQHAMREDISAMRQDISALRQEMVAGNAALRQEIAEGNHMLRQEIAEGNRILRQEIAEGNRTLRQEIAESNHMLRQELRASHGEMVELFNGMTNAILDAMNRGNDRYHSTADEVDSLKARVTKLENPAADAA